MLGMNLFCTNTKQTLIHLSLAHVRVIELTIQQGHSSYSRHIKYIEKMMCLNASKEDGGEYLTLTVLSLPFGDIALLTLRRVYAWCDLPVHL